MVSMGITNPMAEAGIILSQLAEISTMEAEVDVFLHISKISSKTLISIPFSLIEGSHLQMGVALTIMHPRPNIMEVVIN